MGRETRAWSACARLIVACASIVLVSCTRQPRSAVDGVVVFDDFIQLERGKSRDTARHEFPVPADGVFVGIIVEDDIDVQLQLERLGTAVEPLARIAVESRFNGEGIELAALDVKGGERLALRLEGPFEFAQPGRVRVKLLRYDLAPAPPPAVVARADAFRRWAAVTRFDMTAEGVRATGYRDLDAALKHLESRDGDAHLAAWARLVRSNANHVYHLDEKASLADARLAVKAFGKLADARGVARARFAEAQALMELGVDAKSKDPTPEEAKLEAARILRELENAPALSVRERARMTNNLAIQSFYAKDLKQAKVLVTRVLPVFREIGDLDGIRMSLANLAAIASESGELQEAARVFDELLPHANELQLPERRASYIYNAAYSQMTIGSTDRAIERWLLLLAASRDPSMPQFEARALDGLGMSYWQRGDIAQAIVLVDQAMIARRKINDPQGVMVNLGSAGSLARESGDPKTALQMHRAGLELCTTTDQRMLMLTQIGRDHAVAGDFERAIATFRDALREAQASTIYYRIRATELSLADALLARSGRTPANIDEALTLAERVLKGAIESGDITQEQGARRVLAQARAARGELTEAQREFEHALALIFRYRAMTASPEQQAASLTRMQATFRGYTDLLMREVVKRGTGKLLPVNRDEENALRVLESARLVSFDAVRMARVDDATQGRIDQLLAQMAGKRVRLASLLDRAGASERQIEQMQLDIANLRVQIDMERAHGTRAGASERLPQEITRPWPPLEAGVTQLSYALGERSAYLWVRDAAGIRATVLAASPAAIERELDRLAARRAAEAGDSAEEFARISGWLLPAGALAPESSRLEIVAEGKLATLPFAALSAPADRSRRLVESHSIVMIGSMLESADRGPASGPHAMRLVALAGFAGPAPVLAKRGLFPVLGSTGAEARAIAAMFAPDGTAPDVKLLYGNAGSADAVKAAWAKGADVFHFATHGLADLRQPLASLLMLPAKDAEGNATYLTAGQVQSWRGDANLVYLSACETAVGPARFADGLPGLQRAFLRAGARGVIATLWPIEDVYASQFATEFYKRYTAGVPAARALSETQRAWLVPVPGTGAGEQTGRRMTAWAHVYYTR